MKVSENKAVDSKPAVCIFHSADLDGHCSGAIVRLVREPHIELIGMNYGNEMDWDAVTGRTVVMVDFSLPIEEMKRLAEVSSGLTWIDHHQTAIDDAKEAGFDPPGLRRVGDAACELSWEYFLGGKMLPQAVRMLGRYDVWKHDDNEDILSLQYGLRSVETWPADDVAFRDVWRPLFERVGRHGATRRWIARGRPIRAQVKRTDEAYAKTAAFETVVFGHRAICLNRGLCDSMAFRSVVRPDHELLVTFYRKRFSDDLVGVNARWVVSLYAPDWSNLDVGAIAKAHGGGGHRGAAGFLCDVLPPELGGHPIKPSDANDCPDSLSSKYLSPEYGGACGLPE